MGKILNSDIHFPPAQEENSQNQSRLGGFRHTAFQKSLPENSDVMPFFYYYYYLKTVHTLKHFWP